MLGRKGAFRLIEHLWLGRIGSSRQLFFTGRRAFATISAGRGFFFAARGHGCSFGLRRAKCVRERVQGSGFRVQKMKILLSLTMMILIGGCDRSVGRARPAVEHVIIVSI